MILLLCACGGGCALFRPEEPLNYQTVQADPRHNTEEAKEEHEQALEIIGKHFDETPCLFEFPHADLTKAEQHLQKALIADVTYGPAHNTLGSLYYWQREYYLAAWEFEYAIKLMPSNPEPYFNLGLIYEDADQPTRALEYYSRAMMLDDQNPEVLIAYIRVEMQQGKTVDEIRPLLKQYVFLETNPENIRWAKDQLGLKPEQIACVKLETLEDENRPTEVPPLEIEPEPSSKPELIPSLTLPETFPE
ncbi:MAG: tetratricopeptide repeat protein [Planctomycetaceae bacterium]|nr:tetratricopeptide repeat protein [Planctomycetaceae bacterium]